MEESQRREASGTAAPNLLVHLQEAFDWSEAQAVDALASYVMSTAAGRALSLELASCNRGRRAA
jgi:hypothetical protein